MSEQEDDVAQVFSPSFPSRPTPAYATVTVRVPRVSVAATVPSFKGESIAYIINFIFQFLDPKTAVDLSTSCSATFRQPLTIRERLITFIPLSTINYFLGFWNLFLNRAIFNTEICGGLANKRFSKPGEAECSDSTSPITFFTRSVLVSFL